MTQKSKEQDATQLTMPSDIEEDMVLTTVDNPHNPKTEYYKWRDWDIKNGYNTEEYLARITDIPDDTDLGNDWIINELTNNAIQSILNHDVLGVYKLV